MIGPTSARDIFEEARAAAIDAERTRRSLAAMEAREGVSGQSWEVRSSAGSPDPMSGVDARLDREREWHARIERDYAVVDHACCILYGAAQDGHGGVAALLSASVADVLWWRYCAAESWRYAADVVGYSESWCHEHAQVAFDLIDSIGVSATIGGLGDAEG